MTQHPLDLVDRFVNLVLCVANLLFDLTSLAFGRAFGFKVLVAHETSDCLLGFALYLLSLSSHFAPPSLVTALRPTRVASTTSILTLAPRTGKRHKSFAGGLRPRRGTAIEVPAGRRAPESKLLQRAADGAGQPVVGLLEGPLALDATTATKQNFSMTEATVNDPLSPLPGERLAGDSEPAETLKQTTVTDGFRVQHISIHGHQMAYRRGGEGPALLLLHGIASSSRTWVPAMALLQNGYTVLAPDFLGHGVSAKPLGDYSLGNHASTVRDFLHLLGIDRATVVGHSFGGGVALQFSYQFPERCERLVLVDAGGLGREVNWILRLMSLPVAEYAMPVLFPGFVRGLGDPVARFFAHRGIGSAQTAEMWRSYRSLTEDESRRAFVRTMRAVIDPHGQSVSALDRLYLAANVPTLIVWGDKDRIIPLDHAYKTHEAIPNSRLEVMKGVGHYPQVEEPFRFAEILRDFLRTTEPARFDPEQLRDLLRRGSSNKSA